MNGRIPTRPIHSRREFNQWVVDLFGDLQIESALMVGNSNGGLFTLNTALHKPERAKKVVLISPAATFVQMGPWWSHLLIPAHVLGPTIRSERMVHRAYEWLRQDFPVDECYARLRFISTVAGYPTTGPPATRPFPLCSVTRNCARSEFPCFS